LIPSHLNVPPAVDQLLRSADRGTRVQVRGIAGVMVDYRVADVIVASPEGSGPPARSQPTRVLVRGRDAVLSDISDALGPDVPVGSVMSEPGSGTPFGLRRARVDEVHAARLELPELEVALALAVSRQRRPRGGPSLGG
jgi:hypothetical protein